MPESAGPPITRRPDRRAHRRRSRPGQGRSRCSSSHGHGPGARISTRQPSQTVAGQADWPTWLRPHRAAEPLPRHCSSPGTTAGVSLSQRVEEALRLLDRAGLTRGSPWSVDSTGSLPPGQHAVPRDPPVSPIRQPSWSASACGRGTTPTPRPRRDRDDHAGCIRPGCGKRPRGGSCRRCRPARWSPHGRGAASTTRPRPAARAGTSTFRPSSNRRSTTAGRTPRRHGPRPRWTEAVLHDAGSIDNAALLGSGAP